MQPLIINGLALFHGALFFYFIMLLAQGALGTLYTYEDYTAYTIPSANGLNISSHYICFGGWVLLRYPSTISIVCNDSLSEALWPNEPGLLSASIHSNYPPDLMDTSGLWLASEWYAFGSCPYSIVQCNASIPLTNHTYEQDEAATYDDVIASDVDTSRELLTSNSCPTNIVNYYNVCSNVVFMAMVYPMDNFDKSVWSRDQLWEFSYVHCNTTALASELGAYVAGERNHFDVDFSWVVARFDVLFYIIVSLLFFGGCCAGVLLVVGVYFTFRRKSEQRALLPWKDDALVNLNNTDNA